MTNRFIPVSLMAVSLMAAMFTGCGSSDDSAGTGSSSAMSSGASSSQSNSGFTGKLLNGGEDEVLIDNVNDRTWVNDADACFAAIVATDTALCADLVFAGSDDWRYPTTAELSDLFTRVKADDNVTLNYIVNTCAVGTASDGHVYTENAANTGDVLTFEPGNSGLRCVRDGKL